MTEQRRRHEHYLRLSWPTHSVGHAIKNYETDKGSERKKINPSLKGKVGNRTKPRCGPDVGTVTQGILSNYDSYAKVSGGKGGKCA